MAYIIIFLEGIITFISPCILPMIPIYITYLGGSSGKKNSILINALGFTAGFSIVFILLGTVAGSLRLLVSGPGAGVMNMVCGGIVVLFGLDFLGVIRVPFKNTGIGPYLNNAKGMNFGRSVLFGLIFGMIWTPCVTAFLGIALMAALQGGSPQKGGMLLFAYAMGLSLPFLLSALMLEQLKDFFSFVKRHYGLINKLSGWGMIFIGILIGTGKLGLYLNQLS